MNICHRHAIGRAFSSARDYDRHARVQRVVALALAERIATQNLPPAPRLLEIGCGTGFLTQALADHGIGGQWLVSDLSPVMVERCRERMAARPAPGPDLDFAVMDGEYGAPPPGPQFDIVCSSMAMQWFDDLESAVGRLLGLLAPGGLLAFTTLASGTFAEWRAAHEAEGLIAGTRALPDVARIEAVLPDRQVAPHRVERHVDRHPSAREFLRALRAIGATTAGDDHQPLPASALRRVMRRFEEAGCESTYEVVTCLYRRQP